MQIMEDTSEGEQSPDMEYKEIELAGHSEKILGALDGNEMANMSKYEDQQKVFISNQSKGRYPDQSFVNLNDSFSQNVYAKQGGVVTSSIPYLNSQPPNAHGSMPDLQ